MIHNGAVPSAVVVRVSFVGLPWTLPLESRATTYTSYDVNGANPEVDSTTGDDMNATLEMVFATTCADVGAPDPLA